MIDAKAESCAAVSLSEQASWKLIELAKITPRTRPLLAPFSANEVLIAGGDITNSDLCGDGFIFNLNDESVRKCITMPDMLFHCDNN